jgi:glucose uptake protein GlcU
MNKNLQAGLGVLLVLMGLIWTLQGLGYLAGSPMTGVTLWAVVGPIVAILGGILLVGVVRSRRP